MKHLPNPNSLGYKIGYHFACVVLACLAILSIAVTVRVVGWLFWW